MKKAKRSSNDNRYFTKTCGNGLQVYNEYQRNVTIAKTFLQGKINY